MNILITNSKTIGYGGAEISISQFAGELKKRGHKVILASTGNFKGLNTEVFRPVEKYPFFVQCSYLKRFFIKVIRKHSIDIVCPQDRITTPAAILAAKSCSLPTVANIRDYWFACPRSSCLRPDYSKCAHCSWTRLLLCAKWYRYFFDLYKWVNLKKSCKILEQADLKLVVSNSLKNKLAACGVKTNVRKIMPPRRLEEFENVRGVKDFKRRYGLKKVVVAYIGSFFYTKGVLQILKFMPPVLKKHRNVSLLMVGDGPLYRPFLKEINDKGLKEQVVLTGRLPFDKIPLCYAASDILLMPNLWEEPFGATLLEGPASGKPVVVSEEGGPSDVKGMFGYTLPPYDTKLWEKKILYLIENPRARASWGKKAKKNSRIYSMDIFADKIEKYYSGLISLYREKSS
ncbi:MAG: glycosyltransferase family 4 protein [Candidatus Woesearchaeota archaeon]